LSLVTRCPSCKTLFRVLPEQLQARGGQVRCGRCMHAFDGFQALAVERLGAPPEPAALPRNTLADPEPKPAANPLSGSAADEPATSAFSSAPDETRPGGLRRRRMPVTACFLLGLLLVGQLLFLFRGELAARSSAMKTVLTSACRIAGCTVALPQRPDLVKIEASDVNMIDPKRPAIVQLTATLRSYADHDLAYPALDLVLTNATEHAVARRIFLPEAYLDGSRDPQAGIPPRGEITVALDLDTGNLNPAGFRLDLLPPP
jgi:predicted Zn finger-like uncharacterized protein